MVGGYIAAFTIIVIWVVLQVRLSIIQMAVSPPCVCAFVCVCVRACFTAIALVIIVICVVLQARLSRLCFAFLCFTILAPCVCFAIIAPVCVLHAEHRHGVCACVRACGSECVRTCACVRVCMLVRVDVGVCMVGWLGCLVCLRL